VFELEATSPMTAELGGSLRAADIQYVGVTSDFSVTQSITSTAIYFGLASYGPWSTPNEVEFRVYIDSNLDGIDDYVLLNTNWGIFYNQASDVFINPIYKIQADGSLVATDFTFWGTLRPPTASPNLDVAPFNTSVMFQAVSAKMIGLTPGQTRFRYHVETRARNAENFSRVADRVPSTGALEYDVAHPVIAPINPVASPPTLLQRPVFLDVDGAQIVSAVDVPSLVTHSRRLLILHHHNAPDHQAEVVDVRSAVTIRPGDPPGSFRTFLTVVKANN
jgi:hypothetical protein